MNKLKKIIFLLLFMMFVPIVNAGSFSASSNYTNPTVGSTVTVTVKADNAAGKFSVSSSNSGVLSGGGSQWIENGSGSFSFKANAVGTATVTISADDVSDSSDGSVVSGTKTITINVKAKSTNNTGGNTSSGNSTSGSNSNKTTKIKSSINYLSSLSVDGVLLNPAFDKNTTEYEITLEAGVDKIVVNGEKESSVSYVNGLGEISVSEGVNFINVVVTAENGAKKTYVIKATVLEEDPIVVNVNNQDMTLVRKVESMPSASDYYISSTVIINDVEIPCYISEITGYTLVALKGNDGNTSLYRYDKDTNTYLDYKELGFNVLRISLLEPDIIPEDYVVGSVNINEQEVVAYTKDGEYPLVYGINLENGEKSFYSYDSHENTIQRFIIDEKSDDYSEYYPYIILGLLGFIIIQFIIMIIIVVSKNKKQRKMLLNKLDTKTELEKKVSSSSLDQTKSMNVITDMVEKGTNINKKDLKKEKKKLKKQEKLSKKENKKLKDDDMYKF